MGWEEVLWRLLGCSEGEGMGSGSPDRRAQRVRPSRQAARGRWWPRAAQSWSPGPSLRSGFLSQAQSRQPCLFPDHRPSLALTWDLA